MPPPTRPGPPGARPQGAAQEGRRPRHCDCLQRRARQEGQPRADRPAVQEVLLWVRRPGALAVRRTACFTYQRGLAPVRASPRASFGHKAPPAPPPHSTISYLPALFGLWIAQHVIRVALEEPGYRVPVQPPPAARPRRAAGEGRGAAAARRAARWGEREEGEGGGGGGAAGAGAVGAADGQEQRPAKRARELQSSGGGSSGSSGGGAAAAAAAAGGGGGALFASLRRGSDQGTGVGYDGSGI
jgi:hypothetical protein